MGDPQSLSQILWSSDPITQRALFWVLGAALLALIAIYIPLWVRLGRLFMLERRVAELSARFGAPGSDDEAEQSSQAVLLGRRRDRRLLPPARRS